MAASDSPIKKLRKSVRWLLKWIIDNTSWIEKHLTEIGAWYLAVDGKFRELRNVILVVIIMEIQQTAFFQRCSKADIGMIV